MKIQRERSRLERERSKFAEREARSTLLIIIMLSYKDDYNEFHDNDNDQTDCNTGGTATASSPKRDHGEDCGWQGVQVRSSLFSLSSSP